MRGGIPSIDDFIRINLISKLRVPVEINTGKETFSKRGEIMKFNESEFWTFNGTQAWPAKSELNGTMELFTDPLQYNMQVTVVNSDQLRNLYFEPKAIKKVFQFAVNYMEWSPQNYNTKLPDFDSTIGGINNLSRFNKFPWVSSLTNFNKGTANYDSSNEQLEFHRLSEDRQKTNHLVPV